MYRGITIAALCVAAVMFVLMAIIPQKFVKKSILENKPKLIALRIFAALVAVIAVVMIIVIMNSPYLFR